MQPEHKAHHGTAVERCSIGRPCAQKCAAVLSEKGFVIGERMIGARPGNHPQPDTGSRGFLEWQVARLGFRQGGLDMRDEGFDWQGLAARQWLYEHQIWIKPEVQWFRSEEGRVGKEGVRTGRSRGAACPKKKKNEIEKQN